MLAEKSYPSTSQPIRPLFDIGVVVATCAIQVYFGVRHVAILARLPLLFLSFFGDYGCFQGASSAGRVVAGKAVRCRVAEKREMNHVKGKGPRGRHGGVGPGVLVEWVKHAQLSGKSSCSRLLKGEGRL